VQRQRTGLILAVLLLAVPQKAFAYVDPGGGAMVWQLLAATFLGALFYARKIALRIRSLWEKPENPRKLAVPRSRPSISAGD
jgi:hypothetical protein